MKKYYLASLISVVYIALITIMGELFEPLKNFLKNTFWHHWLGKSIVLAAIFALSAIIFSKTKSESEKTDEKYLAAISWLSFLGALAIFVFFSYEYFKHL